MPGLPATAVQDKKILHLKDANTEAFFTLGWHLTFIQKKKTELGLDHESDRLCKV